MCYHKQHFNNTVAIAECVPHVYKWNVSIVFVNVYKNLDRKSYCIYDSRVIYDFMVLTFT